MRTIFWDGGSICYVFSFVFHKLGYSFLLFKGGYNKAYNIISNTQNNYSNKKNFTKIKDK